jgi:hypothetical protein
MERVYRLSFDVRNVSDAVHISVFKWKEYQGYPTMFDPVQRQSKFNPGMTVALPTLHTLQISSDLMVAVPKYPREQESLHTLSTWRWK